VRFFTKHLVLNKIPIHHFLAIVLASICFTFKMYTFKQIKKIFMFKFKLIALVFKIFR